MTSSDQTARPRARAASRSAAALGLALALSSPAQAADHRESPRLTLSPGADIADLYAFVATRYDDPSAETLTVVVALGPYSEPGAGPAFDRFADDLVYSIHIADPVTAATLATYSFTFSDVAPVSPPGLLSADTFLSYGTESDGAATGPVLADGTRRNYTQFYAVSRSVGGAAAELASGLPTAPPNVGLNATPLYNDGSGAAVSGAQTFAQLDGYTQAAIHDLPSGEVVFAGPREDGFYADLAGLFDLVDQRLLFPSPSFPDTVGQQGGGPDTLAGFNVATIALQIPIEHLASLSAPYTAAYFGQEVASEGVGVWASVERPAERRGKGGDKGKGRGGPGGAERIDRMGAPLFNMLFTPLADKEAYNAGHPADDLAFEPAALSPEIAALINARHSPPLAPLAETGRADLAALFLPDMLRVDTTTGPVPLPGQIGFDRLSVLGGDTTDGKASGWPNGRRFGDDVVDIVLTAVASGPDYLSVTPFGDNVNANDQLYNQIFPFAATPHSPTAHSHH